MALSSFSELENKTVYCVSPCNIG